MCSTSSQCSTTVQMKQVALSHRLSNSNKLHSPHPHLLHPLKINISTQRNSQPQTLKITNSPNLPPPTTSRTICRSHNEDIYYPNEPGSARKAPLQRIRNPTLTMNAFRITKATIAVVRQQPTFLLNNLLWKDSRRLRNYRRQPQRCSNSPSKLRHLIIIRAITTYHVPSRPQWIALWFSSSTL